MDGNLGYRASKAAHNIKRTVKDNGTIKQRRPVRDA